MVRVLHFFDSQCRTVSIVGLPPVPLLAGRPDFWPLCPASRHQPRRDASCPAFWWQLVEVVFHCHYITVGQ